MKRVAFLLMIILVYTSSVMAHKEIGLSVGEVAPDFTAIAHSGDEITLSEVLKKGPVVLVFYRGDWCHYCNIQLRELQENFSAFQELNATLIAVSVDKQEYAVKSVEEKGLAFPVIGNPEADLIEAYHLSYNVPQELAQEYMEKYNIDLVEASGRTDLLISIPATYVVDTDGYVTYAFVEEDYKVRAPITDVLEALKEKDTIGLSECSDEKLGISFYCNGDWGLETSDETLFIVIKENDPSFTVTITKSNSPVLSMQQLTPAILKEMGSYGEEMATSMVAIDDKDAIRIDGTAKDYPDVRLRDYYVIDNFKLYGILFALSPKEKWGEYESLTTMIMNSFTFTTLSGGE